MLCYTIAYYQRRRREDLVRRCDHTSGAIGYVAMVPLYFRFEALQG